MDTLGDLYVRNTFRALFFFFFRTSQESFFFIILGKFLLCAIFQKSSDFSSYTTKMLKLRFLL